MMNLKLKLVPILKLIVDPSCWASMNLARPHEFQNIDQISKSAKVRKLNSWKANFWISIFHSKIKTPLVGCLWIWLDLTSPKPLKKSRYPERFKSLKVQKPRTDVRIDDGEERGVCAVCSSSYVVDLRTNACVYMCECGKSGLAASGGGGKYPRRFT